MIDPDWPAPPGVRALVTTREEGDMAEDEGLQQLRELLPDEPVWMRQVHGIRVIERKKDFGVEEADAVITRRRSTVCAVKIADCMPVLLADDAGTVVGGTIRLNSVNTFCLILRSSTTASMTMPVFSKPL